MIKTLSLAVFILFLAWISIDYFSIALPLQKENTQVEIKENLKTPDTNVPEVTTVTSKSIDKSFSLKELLEKNLFYDALAYYLENSTGSNRKQIESYLASLAKTKPLLALEYMRVFFDNVSESMIWKVMIKTYVAQGDFEKAIELLMLIKEDYVSQSQDKYLAIQLKDIVLKYIDALMQRKDYTKLIAFLEEMIAYDEADTYYKFRLAQLYMQLDKVDEAGYLLESLQYDEVYAQNVKTMLNSIDKEEEEVYKYAIPLYRYNEHYTAHVYLDGIQFNLMLDTGATYIFIDEDKASLLDITAEFVTLQTVGNDVEAKRGMVSHLSIGNLALSNIYVTIAPFKREGIDGLLGMNFFRQFTFFINQEESILYLNPKH